MADVSARKRIWGWFMFDWASQPFSTLLLTFIFGPYFAEIMIARLVEGGMADGAARAQAQAAWGYGLTAAGILIAVTAPVIGAIADSRGRRLPYVWGFSMLYVVGAGGLWFADPQSFSAPLLLVFFGVGLVGMEFATIFTNAMLPSLGTREEIGAISGTGWAWGYVGGVLALILMLLLFAENAQGVTFAGIPPLLGLDPGAREGTRFVGPFVALWYLVFMIPFAMWVREPRETVVRGAAVPEAMRELGRTLRSLPKRISMTAYLGSSMFYRDALNGIYTFGGVYALGVLGWTVVDIGIFGIVAAITGAIFAWIGGKADRQFGPKPVIATCIVILLLVATCIVGISRESVLGFAVDPESGLPDIAFYLAGAAIGASGGALQTASRTMMVRQANPDRMTEAFGLYALAGKATTFIAPALIAVVTDITGNQRLGITPLIGLFLLGLILLTWVKPDGDPAWSAPSPS